LGSPVSPLWLASPFCFPFATLASEPQKKSPHSHPRPSSNRDSP
jgi:hypothetical protein